MLHIRADMNDTIATGHIMRCLSIADAARELGEDTVFLVADAEPVELLKARGYASLVLHTQWDDMEAELPRIKQFIKERNIRHLLIDSYQVTSHYLVELTKLTRTMYLDDMAAFFYPVNSILCYANYWRKFHYDETYQNAELYLGLQYVPLRREFGACARKVIKPRVENLLLLSGGTDHYGILKGLLEKVEKHKYQNIDVICGKYDANYGELRGKYEGFANVHIHRAVTNMEMYMDKADMAVAAGGTTLYELCAMGTPTISYSLADNQLGNVRQFAEDGMVEYAGDVREDDVVRNISGYLQEYHENQALRQERSRKMQAAVDGKGARRVAEILMKL